jgi:hypothetical protein
VGKTAIHGKALKINERFARYVCLFYQLGVPVARTNFPRVLTRTQQSLGNREAKRLHCFTRAGMRWSDKGCSLMFSWSPPQTFWWCDLMLQTRRKVALSADTI